MRYVSVVSHPTRTLLFGLASLLLVTLIGVIGYCWAGWSLSDSLYMVIISIFTVGYGEVRPIEGEALRDFTMIIIVLGCFSVIFLSGALVQLLMEGQIRRALGDRRMSAELKKLKGHVIICGYGRIGCMVAADLKSGRLPFVIVDKDPERLDAARTAGYLTLQGDATEETTLIEAGVKNAISLATVLPSDASNVFITLSARGLHPGLTIIARGEEPSTERKLIQAGANRVVLPAHIGAERISHHILFPEATEIIDEADKSHHLRQELGDLGLKLDEAIVPENSPFIGKTITDLEGYETGAIIVVAVHSNNSSTMLHPPREVVLKAGDGIVAVSRTRELSTLLQPAST
jgi:voltage-gated potassium channel